MRKYVFAGSGVANIFCALEMINNGVSGKNILIIDKGKNPSKRTSKDIMSGFLGSGAFSDFKVIYSLTRGGDLVKYTGEQKAKTLIDRIKKIIKYFHPEPSKIVQSGKEKIPQKLRDNIEQYFRILQSESNHIGTDFAKRIGVEMYNFMIYNNVEFQFETEITDINFNKKFLITKDKKYIPYEELIIGIGRSGMSFMNKISKKYKLETDNTNLHIGVRFESEAKYFKELSDVFYDFKLQKNINGINVRTFCVNSGAAYVAKEEVNGLISYNGHAYRNKESNGKINFGIIMEIPYKGNALKETERLVKECNEDKVNPIFENIGIFMAFLNEVFKFEDDYELYIPEVKYVVNKIKLEKMSMSLSRYKNVHLIGEVAGTRGIYPSAGQGLHLADYFKKEEKR